MYSVEFLPLDLNYILMITFTKATRFSSEVIGRTAVRCLRHTSCRRLAEPTRRHRTGGHGLTPHTVWETVGVSTLAADTKTQLPAAIRNRKQNNVRSGQFPLTPVVKTQLFLCWGPDSVPAQGPKVLQAVREGRMKGVQNLNYA